MKCPSGCEVLQTCLPLHWVCARTKAKSHRVWAICREMVCIFIKFSYRCAARYGHLYICAQCHLARASIPISLCHHTHTSYRIRLRRIRTAVPYFTFWANNQLLAGYYKFIYLQIHFSLFSHHFFALFFVFAGFAAAIHFSLIFRRFFV